MLLQALPQGSPEYQNILAEMIRNRRNQDEEGDQTVAHGSGPKY